MTDDHKHHHSDHIEDIDCLEAIEQIYAYLDEELDAESLAKFEKHLQHCRSCFSRKELEIRLAKRIQDSTQDQAPDSLRDRLKDLIDNF